MSRCCICCPYPLIAIPIFISFNAMFITWIATGGCTFFESSNTYADDTTITRNYGLWKVQDNAAYNGTLVINANNYDEDDILHIYCIDYRTGELDGPIQAGSALATLVSVACFPLVIALLVASCARFGKGPLWRHVLAGFFGSFGSLTLLTMVALLSRYCQNAETCRLRYSGGLFIVASLLWLGTGACVYLCTKERFYFPESSSEVARATPVAVPVSIEMSAAAAAAAVGGQQQDDGNYPMAIASPAYHATLSPAQMALSPGNELKEVSETVHPDGTRSTKTTITTSNIDGSKTVTETLVRNTAEE